jgi:hypothetical protein
VEALTLAPDFARIVPPRHSHLVARLVFVVGHVLSHPRADLDALETAARLHHLGAVTIDGDDTVEFRRASVSAMTGAMLRDIEPLAHTRSVLEGRAGTASAVLETTTAFHDLVAGDLSRATVALDELRSAPARGHDPVVVDALAFVVEHRIDLV